MKIDKRILIFLVFYVLGSINLIQGQETPIKPVSYRLFSPFVLNPAIAGSKDISYFNVLTSTYGRSNSQIVTGNLRLSKSRKEYFSSISTPEFSKIGVGGYLFNDHNDLSRSIGIGVTGSYHMQLDANALSFLSFGVSAKAVYNIYKGDPDLNKPKNNTFFPNLDAGVYYYNSGLYAGISATNLIGNPEDPDSLGIYNIPVSRQFILHAGYKIVLSKIHNILLEPSLIINTNDSFSGKIIDMFEPAIKLYTGNFCLGTYFYDFNKISFFFQYNYDRFYVGTYFAVPYNEPYYKYPLLAEFAFGINLSAIKSGITRKNHW